MPGAQGELHKVGLNRECLCEMSLRWGNYKCGRRSVTEGGMLKTEQKVPFNYHPRSEFYAELNRLYLLRCHCLPVYELHFI